MKAYVFPGQGAQFPGMAKDLYESSAQAKDLLDSANEILGFNITDIMFEGTADELKQTKVTQPAIFLHSVVLAKISDSFAPDMVAGHSLGEFSALVASGVLSFEDGLKLVSQRALAMQKACEINPSTMAAILGLEDQVVEDICSGIDEVVVAANYNCPGQLVISGSHKGIELACEAAKEADDYQQAIVFSSQDLLYLLTGVGNMVGNIVRQGSGGFQLSDNSLGQGQAAGVGGEFAPAPSWRCYRRRVSNLHPTYPIAASGPAAPI